MRDSWNIVGTDELQPIAKQMRRISKKASAMSALVFFASELCEFKWSTSHDLLLSKERSSSRLCKPGLTGLEMMNCYVELLERFER